jgi:Putative transposase
VAIERFSLTAQGHNRYALKTPYRDGTTHVIFEPLDFLARLATGNTQTGSWVNSGNCATASFTSS